ncbi:MFS transporter [bacterium]|nr:MFS transporter [bacterium]
MKNKIIRSYFLGSFLISFINSLDLTAYQLFLKSHDLSLLEINLVNLSFMISSFILEIPTGAYADIFGRKKSIFLGSLIISFGFLSYFLATSFWMFIFSEIIIALGGTFVSGALDAWLVDTVSNYDKKVNLKVVFKKTARFHFLGLLLGVFIGSQVASINLSYPWFLSFVFMFIFSFLSLYLFKHEVFSKEKSSWSFKPMTKVAKDSIKYGFKHKGVFNMILFSSVICLCFQTMNMQWPILFESLGFSVKDLGFIFILTAAFLFLGQEISVWFSGFFRSEKMAIIFSQIITALGMFFAGLLTGSYGIVFFFLVHELGRGVIKPLKQSYLNERIESKKRATVLSFDSMVVKLGAGLGLLFSGIIADNYSIQFSWLVFSLLIFLSIIIFYFAKNGKKQVINLKWIKNLKKYKTA